MTRDQVITPDNDWLKSDSVHAEGDAEFEIDAHAPGTTLYTGDGWGDAFGNQGDYWIIGDQ